MNKNWQSLRFVLRFIFKYRGRVALCLGLVILQTAFTLLYPLLIMYMIDRVFMGHEYALLQPIIIAMLSGFVAMTLVGLATTYLYAWIEQHVMQDVRLMLFEHLQSLSMGFFSRTKLGEIVSRVNNDVGQIKVMITGPAIDLIKNVLLIGAIFAVLIYMNAKLFLIALAALPLYTYVLRHFNPRVSELAKRIREQIADMVQFFTETFGGIKQVKVYQLESYSNGLLSRKNLSLVRLNVSNEMLIAVANGITVMVMAIAPVTILYLGGKMVAAGTMTLGELIAFNTYLGRMFGPFSGLANLYLSIVGAGASVVRIREFLDVRPDVLNAPSARPFGRLAGEISLEKVTFAYDTTPVVTDVSLRIEKGSFVALVGPNGSGKSTIASLIMRLYDPRGGRILVDGVDLREIDLDSYRRGVCMVSQDEFLFNSTIGENIRIANLNASAEELGRAVESAGLSEFVGSLPAGLDTVVGERGVQLSGGQRQKISIARCLLRNPSVVIFDEATAALDRESERRVQRFLRSLPDTTCIVIGHHVSAFESADRIYVLEEGRLRQEGTHEALMRREGLYRALYEREESTEPHAPEVDS